MFDLSRVVRCRSCGYRLPVANKIIIHLTGHDPLMDYLGSLIVQMNKPRKRETIFIAQSLN